MELHLSESVYVIHKGTPQSVHVVGKYLRDGVVCITVSNELICEDAADAFYIYFTEAEVAEYVYKTMQDAVEYGKEFVADENDCRVSYSMDSLFKDLDLDTKNCIELRAKLASIILLCQIDAQVTLQQLADKADIPVNTLQKWVDGKANPTLTQVSKILGKLGIKITLEYSF